MRITKAYEVKTNCYLANCDGTCKSKTYRDREALERAAAWTTDPYVGKD